MSGGGRFDFDDGGTYCGGWEDGKAHGYGVCTGPKGQGEYSGAWTAGFEASGVYNWPSGNNYKGQWLQGKRHGAGIETKGRWVYKGEWTQGFKGRYGVRQSTSSGAKYEGTWTTGLQDGYGVETYADGGSYQGQWLRGMRHGYGVRHSVPYGLASHYRPKALRASLTSLRSEAEDDHVVKDRDRKVDESRGGFVLKAKSDESPTQRRRSLFDKHGRSSLRKGILNGLKLRKQKSTGDIKDSPRRPTGSVRSTVSNISNASADSSASGVTSASMYTDSNLSFVSQDDINDVNVTETYMGEWKNDKRSGFGISERSDGLKYEGEWYNNKKYGYGVTTFKDGTKEEGKYKNNILISSGKKSKLFLIRSSKMRERVDNAVTAAQRAAQIAHQKADIAITRMANARAKAESAEEAAERSIKDSELARIKAKEFAPDFVQPGTDPSRQRPPAEHSRGYDTIPNHHQQIHDKIQPQNARSLSATSPHTNFRRASPPPDNTTALPRDSYPNSSSARMGASPMSALVSSAMDCVIGPSSTQIAGNLRRLEDKALNHQHQRYPEDEPYDDRYGPPPPGGPGPPGGIPTAADYARVSQNHIQPMHAEESYSRVPNHRDRPYSPQPMSSSTSDPRLRGGGGFDTMPPDPRRAGGGYEAAPMASSNDPRRGYDDQRSRGYDSLPHDARYRKPAEPYDPYSRTKRDDSGLGPEMDYPSPDDPRMGYSSMPRHMPNQAHPGPYGYSHPLDRSPDSGMSDSEDFRHISRPLVRRKTLPSIMQAQPTLAGPTPGGSVAPSNAVNHNTNKVGATQAEPPARTPGPDLYVIENGIRKRVKAEVYAQPVRPNAERPKDVMPNRLKLEKMASRGAKGSLPDVSVVHNMEVMPREIVAELSAKRRAEVLAMGDEEARRKQQELVLRLTDLKDWCQQRQLMMLVIAVNVSLATMFFNLLSQ